MTTERFLNAGLLKDPHFESRPLDRLPRFEFLHEFVVISSLKIQEDTLQTMASKWFERNPRLLRIKAFHKDSGRLIQRGVTKIESLDTDWDKEVWAKYQEDSYRPLRIV